MVNFPSKCLALYVRLFNGKHLYGLHISAKNLPWIFTSLSGLLLYLLLCYVFNQQSNVDVVGLLITVTFGVYSFTYCDWFANCILIGSKVATLP